MADQPDDTTDADDTGNSTTTPDVFDRALSRFDEITAATQQDRMLSLEDRRFVFIEGAQWEGDWGAQFENGLRVQINKTQRGHDKIINDYRANRFTVDFRPKDDDANDDTAELLNGLMYADIYHSKAQQAFDNAFGEGASGGFGAWRLRNDYEDDYDPDNDHQRICIEQVPDADQRVFFDLDAKLYDKSDARFCFVLSAMTPAAFTDEYGEDKKTSFPVGVVRWTFDWFRPAVVYIAEYYEVEEAREELRIFTRDATDEEYRYWAKELTSEIEADLKARGFAVSRRRNIKRRRVHKWILSGAEVLEDAGHIAGENIPIVPFYGKRVFIDNVERFKGHVRDAKDPARVYNAETSMLMEIASLTPMEVPYVAPEQVEGLENHWATANINRNPYRLLRPLIDPVTGSIVASGPMGSASPPQVPPVLATLLQQTANDIAEITYGDDSSMEIKSNVSGEAMDIAAARVDAKSFIYMDNFKQSMQRFGEVYYSMAREVYIEEGRQVETMNEDGHTETATLHELHANPKTGITAKRYDLSVGKFNVVADVTEATSTRRDKTVRTMMTLSEAAAAIQDTDMARAALLTALKNMDGEGIDTIQEYAHKIAISIGLDEPTPEEQAAAQGQQQQPDPAAIAALAQAKALNSQAGKFDADAGKAKADTKQSEAKTVLTLAQAKETNAKAKATYTPHDLSTMLQGGVDTTRRPAQAA